MGGILSLTYHEQFAALHVGAALFILQPDEPRVVSTEDRGLYCLVGLTHSAYKTGVCTALLVSPTVPTRQGSVLPYWSHPQCLQDRGLYCLIVLTHSAYKTGVCTALLVSPTVPTRQGSVLPCWSHPQCLQDRGLYCLIGLTHSAYKTGVCTALLVSPTVPTRQGSVLPCWSHPVCLDTDKTTAQGSIDRSPHEKLVNLLYNKW